MKIALIGALSMAFGLALTGTFALALLILRIITEGLDL